MNDRIVEHSRQMIREGSKSFSAAARLFDQRTREDVHMLYAWCRYCDDQVDGQTLGHFSASERRLASDQDAILRQLCAQTRSAVNGDGVTEPEFVGLQRVVQGYQIPERFPLELLEGFAMDVHGHTYDRFEETLRYCYHVAGAVGIMMAYMMGVRCTETLDRAADLGLAFQLTNIARDVSDDARMGRIYLPTEWLETARIPRREILQEQHRPALVEVVKRLLKEADRYYHSAVQGLPQLPFRCSWAVATALGVYRNIGDLLCARGRAAWDERLVVNRRRKVFWGLRGFSQALTAISWGRLQAPAPRDGLWQRPAKRETRYLDALV